MNGSLCTGSDFKYLYSMAFMMPVHPQHYKVWWFPTLWGLGNFSLLGLSIKQFGTVFEYYQK